MLTFMQSPLSTVVVTALLQILAADDTQANILETSFYTSINFNLDVATSAVLCLFSHSDSTTNAPVIAATDVNSLPKELF